MLIAGCGGSAIDAASSPRSAPQVPPRPKEKAPSKADLESARRLDLPDIHPPTTAPSPSAPPTTAPPPPPPPPPTKISIPGDLLFDTDKADLKPEANDILATFASQLRDSDPNAHLLFVGHTDSRGSQQHNLDLSARRAAAVEAFFRSQGFSPALLSSTGVGTSEPALPDVDSSGRFNQAAGAANRRVVIVLS